MSFSTHEQPKLNPRAESVFYKSSGDVARESALSLSPISTPSKDGFDKRWLVIGSAAVVIGSVLVALGTGGEDAVQEGFACSTDAANPESDCDELLDSPVKQELASEKVDSNVMQMGKSLAHEGRFSTAIGERSNGTLEEVEDYEKLFEEREGPTRDVRYISFDVPSDVIEALKLISDAGFELDEEIQDAIENELFLSSKPTIDDEKSLEILKNSSIPLIRENADAVFDLVSFLKEKGRIINDSNGFVLKNYVRIFSYPADTMHTDFKRVAMVYIGLPTVYEGPNGEIFIPNENKGYMLNQDPWVIHRSPTLSEVKESELQVRIMLAYLKPKYPPQFY